MLRQMNARNEKKEDMQEEKQKKEEEEEEKASKSMRRQLRLVARPTPPVRFAEPENQKAEEQLTQHDRVNEDTAKLGSSADTFCAT